MSDVRAAVQEEARARSARQAVRVRLGRLLAPGRERDALVFVLVRWLSQERVSAAALSRLAEDLERLEGGPDGRRAR